MARTSSVNRWIVISSSVAAMLSIGGADAQTITTGAKLRGLDKTTARVIDLPVEIGKPVQFRTLTITLQDCRKSPPEDPPENAAYLDIKETKLGDKAPQPLFIGWMFSSSPAVSALEHPIYDIWVIDCTMPKTSPKSTG